MIRPYQTSDYDTLIQLMRLNTPAFFGVEEEAHLVTFLQSNPPFFFVLEEEKVIVGCAGYSYQADTHTGQVSWFIFHPDYQGRGLGRRILNFCMDRLREKPALLKIVVRTSQLAEGFFASAGFKTTYQEQDYWAPGFDLYVMEYYPN